MAVICTRAKGIGILSFVFCGISRNDTFNNDVTFQDDPRRCPGLRFGGLLGRAGNATVSVALILMRAGRPRSQYLLCHSGISVVEFYRGIV